MVYEPAEGFGAAGFAATGLAAAGFAAAGLAAGAFAAAGFAALVRPVAPDFTGAAGFGFAPDDAFAAAAAAVVRFAAATRVALARALGFAGAGLAAARLRGAGLAGAGFGAAGAGAAAAASSVARRSPIAASSVRSALTSSAVAGRASSSTSRRRVMFPTSSSAISVARPRVRSPTSAVAWAVAWKAWSTAERTVSARLAFLSFFFSSFFLAMPRTYPLLPVPFHLIPTAELAPRALLPGDPGRALTLAQLLLEGPRMFNHARGLWGYTGLASDGEPLTIQSTGLGGPSTAAVLEDLHGLGLETAVRVGSCRADGPDPALGTILTVGRAIAQDGVSVGAGATQVQPDLVYAGDAVVLSRDRLAPGPTFEAPVADRTTAPFLVVAGELGLRCGALLAVTSDIDGNRLDAEELLAAEHALGHAAARALGLPDRIAG